MAMPQPASFSRIVRVPGIVGGEPTILGTRIAVRHVVVYYQLYQDVDEILRAYPHLTRDDVAEALAVSVQVPLAETQWPRSPAAEASRSVP